MCILWESQRDTVVAVGIQDAGPTTATCRCVEGGVDHAARDDMQQHVAVAGAVA